MSLNAQKLAPSWAIASADASQNVHAIIISTGTSVVAPKDEN
jgi:hypothetical protein